MKINYFCLLLLWPGHTLIAQNVQINVDLQTGRRVVSPYIYGRNGSLSDDPGSPVSAGNWQLYKDAGLNFFRENGGNDLTKHNWQQKLDSHPDWYNNVYISDWDFAAQSLHQNIPTAQGMWGFQLIGEAPRTTANNFNDFGYNGSQWWSGVEQNLAGGGVVNPAGGSQALVNGDTLLYLEKYPADSTTAILNHWFGSGGLGLDPTKIRYWNMDNEIEIWSSTHDDVMPTQLSAESFMQLYFAVAKAARALYPGIKLTGPVSPNEWQWYNWASGPITGSDGKQYCWMQYFIKRIAEEEASTGIRLLDVVDVHFYPSSSTSSDIVQYGRVFFDSAYNFPEANGVKMVNNSWDNSIQIEDFFGRCASWLNQYMGPNNGVTFAVSETGLQTTDPNVTAVWYASTMGEFMKHGVEYFSPWTWAPGMWETLHLYSRYNLGNSIQASSSDSINVGAYATTNAASDSVTVALVNKSLTTTETVTINFSNFVLPATPVTALTLSNLPATETFVSQTNNALQTSNITPQANTLQVTLAPLSVTSIVIAGNSAILPVTLLDFEAEKASNGVQLNFATTGAPGLSSFTIERSSDGVSFTPIGSVAANAAAGASPGSAAPSAAANSGGSQKQYIFPDNHPLPSLNEYRLKMIAADGSYTYSKTVAIRYDGMDALSIFPNPVNDALNVQLHLPAGVILLQVVDAVGRTVKTMQVQSSGATLAVLVDTRGLSKGIYYLRAAAEIPGAVVPAAEIAAFMKQ
jgi:hypothetical protein